MSLSVTQHLAEFATSRLDPPKTALEMIRLSLFDWAACAIAGRDEPASRLVRDMVLAEAGAAQALAIGTVQDIPARAAALLGGVASHALDYDDTHFAHIGHPSVAVLPAACAVAQMRARSADEMLRASLIGAELSVRLGVWLGRGHYQMGYHQTGTAGCFGAAIAAGILLKLDAAQMEHCLGLASTKAAGLKSQFGTMGKPYNAGQAAASGVEVAVLAEAGFASNGAGIEGAQGFGPTHGGAGDLSGFDGLGDRWFFEDISHKFHACCHGTHAMIEALAALDVSASEVAQLRVRTHPRWMSVCNQMAPETGLGVKFSYAMIAALVLAGHDTARLDSFSDARATDPQLVALRDRVEVTADETVGEMQSQVAVTRHDGQVVETFFDLAAPISFEKRRDKLRAKADALLGHARAEMLAQAVLTGPTPDLDGLRDQLRAQ